MKLAYRITSRISFALLLVMAVWASIFYYILVTEINDETDDALEALSEDIILRALGSELLPQDANGTNNMYFLTEVSADYARQHPTIRYHDEMIYIESKEETEPARILKTIFMDANIKYYELTVAIPTIEKSDLQEAILHWIVILYFVLLAVIIGLNFLILHQSFKPLYKLLAWLDNFSLEKKFVEPEIQTTVTEFSKLNTAVIRSSYRSVQTFEHQKAFLGNASHELQTPLAVCLNRLEMLADNQDLTEEQLLQVLKTKQSLEYAIKLNKVLLLLARIENDQFPERKEIKVNDLFVKLLADYEEVYGYLGISVNFEQNTTIILQMNETLASILFGNLIKNAFFHNYPAGEISIHFSNEKIQISNTGSEEPLDSDSIFTPFYKATHKTGSTGLGLALCKSICKLYKMEISYHYEKRHVFSINLDPRLF